MYSSKNKLVQSSRALPPEKMHLVIDNIPLVKYIVCKYFNTTSYDYDDFIQQGYLGLMYAATTYDPNKNSPNLETNPAISQAKAKAKFSTYASKIIINYCQKYRRQYTPKVHYPRSVIDTHVKIKKAQEQGISDQVIQTSLGITSWEFNEALQMYAAISLDQHITNQDQNQNRDLTLGEVIPGSKSPEDQYIETETLGIFISALKKTLERAPEKHARLYREYIFSRIENGPKSEGYRQIDLAEKYDYSQAQVSRIIKKLNTEYIKYLKRAGIDV